MLFVGIKKFYAVSFRGQPKEEVFLPLASVAEGFRPKILAEGLGHIFGKIFRCNGQSVLITISFLQFLYFRYKKKSLFCKMCRLFRKWSRTVKAYSKNLTGSKSFLSVNSMVKCSTIYGFHRMGTKKSMGSRNPLNSS